MSYLRLCLSDGSNGKNVLNSSIEMDVNMKLKICTLSWRNRISHYLNSSWTKFIDRTSFEKHHFKTDRQTDKQTKQHKPKIKNNNNFYNKKIRNSKEDSNSFFFIAHNHFLFFTNKTTHIDTFTKTWINYLEE